MTAPYSNDASFDSHSLAHRVTRALAASSRVPVDNITYHPRRAETHPAATLALPHGVWCVVRDAWGTTPTTGRGCLDIDITIETGTTTTGSQLETLATMRLNANACPGVHMDAWEHWMRSVVIDTLAGAARALGITI